MRALSTAGSGALVLLAFLCWISFSSRFPGFGDVQRGTYLAALSLAALAAVVLLAPPACRPVPRRAPRTVNSMAAGGLASAALAWSAAVRLAVRWVSPALAADLAAAGTAALFAVLWFVLPALLSRDR